MCIIYKSQGAFGPLLGNKIHMKRGYLMSYLKKLFKNIDKSLYIVPFLLAIISITMLLSISEGEGNMFSRMVIVQSFSYILGFIAVLIVAHMNLSILEDWTKPLYIFSVLFLFTPFIPGLGVEQYGAKSWINLGITTFQPSEIVKLIFIILMAVYLKEHSEELRYFKGFCKAFLYAAPIILIVLKEDFGSAAVFSVCFIAMVLYAGLDLKLFGRLVFAGCLAFPFAFKILDVYQQQRITGFLYPDDLSIQSVYQVWQAKTAIGSGGLIGKGLFNGTMKNFLPVKESDFIYAVICEELGFIGGCLVLILFTWFLISMTKLSFKINDSYGSLIVIGVVGMFAAQIFENIAMCMGFMPVTGITLPFLSYGGSSVLSNMLAISMVINIAISNRGIAFLK